MENSDYGDSDVLDTPPSNGDEGRKTQKFPRFRMPEDDVEIRIEKGMILNSKIDIKVVIKTLAMVNKKNLIIQQNDLKRVVVKCIHGCPFHLRFSKSN